MGHDRAIQATWLEVEAGGHLEFVADATILFPDSYVETTTTVTLGEGASVILAESFLWHDPSGGGSPRFAMMAASVEAKGANGQLLVLDRYRVERPGEDEASREFWAENKAHGALYAFAPACDAGALVDSLRAALRGIDRSYAAVSVLPNSAGVFMRALAPESSLIRAAQECAWRAARTAITGHSARVSWRK